MEYFASVVDYLSLIKLRILLLLVLVAVATALVAGEGNIFWNKLALLALAGSMACAGSALLNNYLDRDIDAIMPRTQHRPLPEAKVNPAKVLFAGLILLVFSLPVALWLNYLAALFLLLGVLIYILLYTLWLKRRTPINVVIGGLAGSCAVLTGWFSITTQFSLTPLLIALVIFLWTPSHFWSFALVNRESYQRAGIPMLAVIAGNKSTASFILLHSSLLFLVSPLLYWLGPLKEVYLFGSLFLASLFLASSIWLWRDPQEKRAWSHYKFSGVYLLGLFLVIVLDVFIQ